MIEVEAMAGVEAVIGVVQWRLIVLEDLRKGGLNQVS